ncbi:MAG: S41 family peptidase [Anaerostipes sp.]|uniref:S41 family peptidase n=1 Tax=Anaerostipes sp. 992a TaxID=1261637 RepID=UPI0009526B60|nr:S41 family peptidase [Anaerostipes sp. 992a]MCI5952049.1 S41 family peptidase [Anaerostipes sp.]MDD5969856.1 S41 family peptidase [Anaerostipes sp.]OLR61068.1 peptidase [Anaerostipes sp. 992a]
MKKGKIKVRSLIKDILILLLLVVCIMEGIMLKVFVFSSDDGIARKSKLKQLKTVIDEYYLGEVDEEQLREYSYKGMIAGLEDPYSVYYTKEEYEDVEESSEGIFSGVGIVLTQDMETKAITVVKPMKDGPAQKAGIKAGDILTKVEGEEISSDEDLSSVVSRVKGKEGTKVTLTFSRDGKEKDYTLTRQEIKNPTVEYEMLENKVGYIKITEFDEVTVEQFDDALSQLENDGMKKLVLDLRDNPGGLLDAVVDIADRILPTGMIVYTEDKNGKKTEYEAKSAECVEQPIAVLINGNSASASEILAGAIQDYKAGTLVGTTSYGKGIVQNIFQLGDGSAVKLTIANYYTPKGRNIHKKGIDPDVEVELKESLKDEIEIKKSEDNQLQEALKVLEKE